MDKRKFTDKKNKNIKIIIYTSNFCTYCFMAKELLNKNKLEYEEIIIENNHNIMKQLIEKTNYTKIPQIFIKNKFIGGYNELKKIIDKI